MTDSSSSSPKKNSEAMIQMIQSLNAVLYGDYAAYVKCIQLLEDMEQQLQESKKANSTLKDQLDSKTTQLEKTEKNLGESLKTIVETTFEFGRTNEKLLKMIKTKDRLIKEIMLKTKCYDSVIQNVVDYIADKDDRSIIQFGRAAESMNIIMDGMPEQSIGLANLALELEKCRTQCIKDGECSVGKKAREDIASLGADFRFAWRCLDIDSVCLDEMVSCVSTENWLLDFDGYFEEEKKNSEEETSVDHPRNGKC